MHSFPSPACLQNGHLRKVYWEQSGVAHSAFALHAPGLMP